MNTNPKGINTSLNFDNSFIQQLDGFYIPTNGEESTFPKLIKLNKPLAEELGLNVVDINKDSLAQLLSGSVPAQGSQPIAQVYAGHQFGGFSPQLGDGRAILLGEVMDKQNNRRDIHLKGSGKTPFSRGGDGKAAVGPVLREYILGEAMHALAIPATRALAVTLTGDKVVREQLQDGAVLARVASSHIRVGTFQYFAARGENDKVKLLADYTINRHFPELGESKNKYRKFLGIVCEKQARLIAQWMLVGFVHGVMNTDNVAISGETIDFGPCAFIDDYDAHAVFSSIDRQGRYALSNQPYIMQWNIARFAETLLPLLDEKEDKAIEIATNEIEAFTDIYHNIWLNKALHKIGLSHAEQNDLTLVNELFEILQAQKVDYTQFFRSLSLAAKGAVESTQYLFDDSSRFDLWYKKWLDRLATDSQGIAEQVNLMNASNPIYIPRNHLVEEVIKAAEHHQNFEVFEQLLDVLAKPYEKRNGLERYEKPAPEGFGSYKTFCGT